jgi:hypothetical protein
VLTILRRFRGPIIGLVALVFSAGIAFAGQPSSPGAAGLANAATHAAKTVPVQATDEQAGDQTEDTDTDEASPEDNGSADHCNVDLTQDPSVLATLNHGSVVCTAAHAVTPEGFANHGAYVSSFAKGDHGSQGASASAAGKNHKPSNTPPSH